MSEGFNTTAAGNWRTRNPQKFSYGVIIALGLFSLGLYLLLFRPITQEVRELEANLVATRGQIVETGFGRRENPGIYLNNVRSKIEKMRQLANKLYKRMTFRSGLEDLMSIPFRVLEFEQRRFDIQQRLTELAQERESELPTDFLSGLPSYSTTGEDQQRLWLHLEFFNHVVGALLSSGRGLRIEQADSLPIRILDKDSEAEGTLLIIQLQLKVESPATALATFLNGSLPESEAATNSIGHKAYRIARLNIQSNTGNGDGRVTLDTRLTGFIINQ
ncbi:MAG: hypothetical protein GVY36_06945 [Verrucomicrobia bacterium]|jgi:hypothetical protein|nr:hypothetical protein [Verrucomicrobiota bacterium]